MGARTTTDGGANENPNTSWTGDGAAANAPHYPNVWLRMTRELSETATTTNDLFTTYYSTNGTEWLQEGTFDPTTNGNMTPFPNVMYIGMAATAHNDVGVGAAGSLNRSTAIFDNYGPTVTSSGSPTITVSYDAATQSLTVSWVPTGGALYESSTLGSNASWTAVAPGGNPATIPITGTAMFFRVQ
jgi:hypothetical protein